MSAVITAAVVEVKVLSFWNEKCPCQQSLKLLCPHGCSLYDFPTQTYQAFHSWAVIIPQNSAHYVMKTNTCLFTQRWRKLNGTVVQHERTQPHGRLLGLCFRRRVKTLRVEQRTETTNRYPFSSNASENVLKNTNEKTRGEQGDQK